MGCPTDAVVYSLGLYPTALRSDEEEMLLADTDEHKLQAFDELSDRFTKQIARLVGSYQTCRRRLEWLEADATFEQMKQIV